MDLSKLLPLLLTSLSGVITYNSAYKDGIPTCDEYAKNTYLYTLTGILLTWTYWTYMIRSNYLVAQTNNFISLIISFVVFIGILIYVKTIDPLQVLKKNIFWMILIAIFAFISLSTYIFIQPFLLNGLVGATMIAFVTYYIMKQYPNLIDEKTNKKVFLALVALIIISILGMVFIKNQYTLYIFIIIITLASIALMSIRLLIHHSRIEKNNKKCVSGEIKPDYVDESFGVILTILNLILDIAKMTKLTKLKR